MQILRFVNGAALLVALLASIAALHQASVLGRQMDDVQGQLTAMTAGLAELNRMAGDECHDCRWRMATNDAE